MNKLKIIPIILTIFLVATLIYLGSATFPTINNNVLLYFKLDKNVSSGENNTFVRDLSSYGRNGTIFGNPTFILGAYDNALKFDGTDDFINISNMYFDNKTGWAVSMWIKPIATNNKPILLIGDFNTEKGFEIFWSSSDIQLASMTSPYNLYTTTGNYLPVNTWKYLVISWSNVTNNFTMFINGTPYKNISITPIDSYSGNIFIGMPDEGIDPQDYFNGTIDEFMIFNKSLNDTEVSNLYSNYTTERFSCGELYEENKVYNLINNVSSEKTCFEIIANNITINGNYNFINYSLSGSSTEKGIYSINHTNIKVNNLKIYLGNLTTLGNNPDNTYGIYLQERHDNFSMENCSIYVSTRENYPLQIYDNMGISSNVLIKNSLFEFANDTTGYTAPTTIYIEGSKNVRIIDSKLNLTNSYGIGNNTLYLISSSANLTNVSYLGKTSEGITSATLIRKWYFDIEVNTSEGYLNGSNVSVYNFTSFVNSQLTGTKGNISRLELTEYSNNGTRNYYSNIINISKTGFITNSTTLNLTTTNNTFLYVRLIPTLSANIVEPKNQVYSTNMSLDLNFTITNYTGLSTCWYYILNSSNDYEKANTTLTSCLNTTFNVSFSDIYIVYLFLNETSGIKANDSVTFEVSMDAPAIVLNSPVNNTYFSNKTIYFNFTATDSNGLGECSLFGNWTGTYHKNYTWYKPTNDTMNFTILNLSETTSFFNIWCNDTANNGRFALNNYTFTIDTTFPIGNNMTIVTSIGNQSIDFLTNITDLHLDQCNYTIRNLAGGIDGLSENVSFNCNNWKVVDVSAFATYYLYVYGTDKSGNTIIQNLSFTTSPTSGATTTGGAIIPSTPFTQEEPTKLFSILNTNLQNKINIQLAKDSKRPREKTIVFINRAKKPITIKLSCDTTDVNKSSREINVCSYVKFENETLTLSANEDTPTESTFYLYTPDYSDFGENYYFNIIATDQVTKEFSKISVSSSVGVLPTIFYKWSYLPFQSEKSDKEKLAYPVFVISIILSSLILILTIMVFQRRELTLLGLVIGFFLFFASLVSLTLFVF